MSDTPPSSTDAEQIRLARQRAGRAIRDLSHAFIGRHATVDQIDRLSDVLEDITAELWPQDQRSRFDAFRDERDTDYPQGRFTHDFDDRPVSGTSSPWGLDLDLHRHGDEVEARVTLRSAHEGAPGRSHGGIVAALFDDVFGFVLGMIRQSAFTGELSVRYHAPTPLFSELACRVRLDHVDGRKIHLVGELVERSSDTLIATAKALFIAVDPEVFSRLTAERPPPPDEDDEDGDGADDDAGEPATPDEDDSATS